MYAVDERDSVTEINDVPAPDIGAPIPVVVADEHSVLLAYIVSEPDPKWDGTFVSVVGKESAGMPIAIIEFDWPYAHFFGPPNDEAFEGHPLASRGLSPYAVFEIGQSSWIRRLVQMNSVHPHHRADAYADLRHFIFAFHDSTFECVARGFKYAVRKGTISTALTEMASMVSRS